MLAKNTTNYWYQVYQSSGKSFWSAEIWVNGEKVHIYTSLNSEVESLTYALAFINGMKYARGE